MAFWELVFTMAFFFLSNLATSYLLFPRFLCSLYFQTPFSRAGAVLRGELVNSYFAVGDITFQTKSLYSQGSDVGARV